jgi:hypothetical protein
VKYRKNCGNKTKKKWREIEKEGDKMSRGEHREMKMIKASLLEAVCIIVL